MVVSLSSGVFALQSIAITDIHCNTIVGQQWKISSDNSAFMQDAALYGKDYIISILFSLQRMYRLLCCNVSI